MRRATELLRGADKLRRQTPEGAPCAAQVSGDNEEKIAMCPPLRRDIHFAMTARYAINPLMQSVNEHRHTRAPGADGIIRRNIGLFRGRLSFLLRKGVWYLVNHFLRGLGNWFDRRERSVVSSANMRGAYLHAVGVGYFFLDWAGNGELQTCRR